VEKSLWDAWARGKELSPEKMALMGEIDSFLDTPGTKVELTRGGKVVETLVSDGKALGPLGETW
jgi:hypothetical protein